MYNLVLIHSASERRTADLDALVRRTAARFGVQIDFADPAQMGNLSEMSTVAIYLGSPAASSDPHCQNQVAVALGRRFTVVAVVENLARRAQQVPPELEKIKAIEWPPNEKELVGAILEGLGIADRERGIFISYRQADASSVAVQLHHALAERGFKVFLDLFEYGKAYDIQAKIAEALEDMVFVLILQSPQMHESHWVDKEITQALESQLPILVLKWADAGVRVEKLDSLPGGMRMVLDRHRDFDGDRLLPAKVGEILDKVEDDHLEGILRRRKETINAARIAAESKGWTVVERPRWRLEMDHTIRALPPRLLQITSRLARGEDLYSVDQVPDRGILGLKWHKLVLQRATELPDYRKRFLEWAIDARDIQVVLGLNRLSSIL